MVLIYRRKFKIKQARSYVLAAKRLSPLCPAYKRTVKSMSYVYFVRPIYAPIIYPPTTCPPLVYYPLNNVTYRFPVPVLYSTPPGNVL
jgi:hypothetical protein